MENYKQKWKFSISLSVDPLLPFLHLSFSLSPSLSPEAFERFPVLEELELSLNSITHINIRPETFSALQSLDLSYNHLSERAIITLGKIPNLKELHMTGNADTPNDYHIQFDNPSSSNPVIHSFIHPFIYTIRVFLLVCSIWLAFTQLFIFDLSFCR